TMHPKTINMDEAKKNNIISVSINEFAKHGYVNASTNTIVKAAGISKGLLFHYFAHKQGLFSYVYNYCVDLIATELIAKIDLNQRDILVRLRDTMLVKIELSEKFPQIFDFVARVYVEEADEVKNLISQKEQAAIADSYATLITDIDYSLFKAEIDVQKAIKVIIWTLEKFGAEVLSQTSDPNLKDLDYQAILSEANTYLKLFRECFYK
ncbi:MAG: TetR/AcrR family transcriptional regulator, partial [Peptococcaceae bacterium]|nr:TetR/AcrR family transcriptional regulator [Peptococcaceae bacterium]